MTANIKEQDIINRLATDFATIDGIKTTYGFAQIPDTLTNAQLPAVVFFPDAFESDLYAHHNFHKNVIGITAIVFVATRQTSGGSIKFLENRTMPFLGKIRTTFQTESVIKALLALGLVKAYTFSGNYGAGGTLLTFNGVEYIGVIIKFSFTEIT